MCTVGCSDCISLLCMTLIALPVSTRNLKLVPFIVTGIIIWSDIWWDSGEFVCETLSPLLVHVDVGGSWLCDMAFTDGLWLNGLFPSLKVTCLLLFWSALDCMLGGAGCCPISCRLSVEVPGGCCWLAVLGSIL